MNKRWIYIILIILASCAKEADWAPEISGDEQLVVEGIITNEGVEQTIHLYHSKKYLNDDADPVSGAEVIVSNEDSAWLFTEDPQEAGTYRSQKKITALLDKNYALLIILGEEVYTAQDYMVAGKTFPELKYEQNQEDDLYHIDYVASAFEQEDPAMWEIILDWSEVEGYEDCTPGECSKRLLFYTLTTLDVSQVFAPLVEEVSFPAGTRIDQRRYSLSPEHAGFIRTLLLETNWQGGVFPSDPANVQTNISDGGLGFFAVCAVNSLSLIVDP